MSASAQVKPTIQQLIDDANSFIEPRPGRLVVVRDSFKYSGLIYIPEKNRQLPTTGYIVAVGDEEQKWMLGKRIVWARFAGVMIHFDKRPAYDILTYEEVQGILKDDSELSMEDMSSLNRE